MIDITIRIENDNLFHSIENVLKALKDSMEKGSYEFSLGSKLLHTKNDASPIYDSKVRDYLASEEGVDFSHPFRVTLCQVVIDCDNMNAFSFQRIQISR